MKLFTGHKASLVNYTFQILLVTYLVLLLIEQIWTGVVSVYLNLNYLLIGVIVIGILDVFSDHPHKTERRTDWKDYSLIILLGILGAAIIKYKTNEIGLISWVISIIAGILIILLSILVMEEEDDSTQT